MDGLRYELVMVDQDGNLRLLPVVQWFQSETGPVALVDYATRGSRASFRLVPYDLSSFGTDGLSTRPTHLGYVWGFVLTGQEFTATELAELRRWRKERDRDSKNAFARLPLA